MLETLKEFFKQYGSIGLFLNAFFDGFCLPLPPDFLLSTLVIQQIGNPTILAIIFFKRFGVWAIVIDAFTPIPYKALTLGSGLMKFNPFLFAMVSFPVRTIRYILVANTASFIGDQLRSQFERTFLLLVIAIILIICLGMVIKNKLVKQN